MKLKQYCVTVMDHWTPMREFWTYTGALAFRNEHLAYAHLHQWFGDGWGEVLGPPSRSWTHRDGFGTLTIRL